MCELYSLETSIPDDKKNNRVSFSYVLWLAKESLLILREIGRDTNLFVVDKKSIHVDRYRPASS